MLVCLPTAQNSVEANEGVKISTCKEPKENALFGTQRNCGKELGETAKPLFIGSIPIAASNPFNNLQTVN